jgi:23S rRNA (pseudouridine1915-N3)-methyltransferase
MVVRIIAVGRLKSSALREVCETYLTRLRRRQRTEVVEVREAGTTDRNAASARAREARAILAALPEESRAVALTRTGTAVTSEGLARTLEAWRRGARDVALIIGGAHGLGSAVLDRCEERLSLSALTLPHELARVVLLEQLYRADTILRGEPYHKPSVV